jgi:hypothetical protein
MLFPACTGFGDATFDTVRSGAVVPTTVFTVAVLLEEFGSAAEELADAESTMIVPLATPVFTFTTSVNVAAVEAGMFEFVQTTFPVPPTAGPRQLHPAGAEMDAKVVFAGTAAT